MELKELMKNAGIIGAGGAGFPSYAKLAEGADTLLINGSECEPLLYTDYEILKRERDTVIEGALAVLEGSTAKRALLCLKRHTADRLSLREGDRLANGITVKVLRDSYPIGDEVSLIYEATGKVVRPGNLPISVGAIVYNVETLYNLGRYVRYSEPVIEKWLTVGGDVEKAVVIKVPVGTPVSHIFKALGIKVTEDTAVLDGGPSMGKIIDPDTYHVTKTTKGILLLPRSSEAVRSKLINEKMAASRAETACCQCTRCTDMCPRYLLGYPLEPHKMVRTAVNPATADPSLILTATLCCGCGICESLACSQGISPKAVINGYKAILSENKLRYVQKDSVYAREEREYRVIPSGRWASALGVGYLDKLPEYIEDFPKPSHVEIGLKSHIGAPSVPTVKEGSEVRVGEVIAEANEGLSVPQHASLTGKITLSGNKIRIDKG